MTPRVLVATRLRLSGPQSMKATVSDAKPIAIASGAPAKIARVSAAKSSRVAPPGLTGAPSR